jgi:hypothetical protein
MTRIIISNLIRELNHELKGASYLTLTAQKTIGKPFICTIGLFQTAFFFAKLNGLFRPPIPDIPEDHPQRNNDRRKTFAPSGLLMN